MDVYRDFQHAQESRYHIIEGSIVDGQVEYIIDILRRRPEITAAFETGFNGGRSAAAILSARPDITLVSFDTAEWDYVDKAKALIDARFPGRHTLVVGDTLQTLPEFVKGREGTFQFGLIDGGHVAPTPESDIRHAGDLLCPGGLLLVDDYSELYGGQGVMAGYDAAIASGFLATADGPMHSGDRTWIVAERVAATLPSEEVHEVVEDTKPACADSPVKKAVRKKKVIEATDPAAATPQPPGPTPSTEKVVRKRKPKAIVV